MPPRAAAAVADYRLFARSDLLMALAASLVMACAGAGMASWFGAGGAAYADTYAVQTTAAR